MEIRERRSFLYCLESELDVVCKTAYYINRLSVRGFRLRVEDLKVCVPGLGDDFWL